MPSTDFAGQEEVTIHAREQEKDGAIYKLRGDVEIDFRSLIFRGQEVTYNSATGEVTAAGQLTLDGGPNDEHIEASHGTYNIRSETGMFFDAVGTTGVRVHGPHVTLTSSAPFTFTGRRVEKTGPGRYVLYYGSVTACELPRPKWTFNAAKITIDVGGEARMYNSSFRVERVPVIYLPFAQHPVDTLGRSTGFLIPTIGTSSRKGLVLGDSFYWAINRSADATAGAEYFSKRGWAEHGDFRWRPSADSYVKFHYFGVIDRGLAPLNIKQGGEDVTLDSSAEFPHGVRGVASIEYLSSFVFRLAFTEGFSQTVNSEVKSNIFATKTVNGFSLNSLFSRYQNFQSTTPGDVVTITHVPTFDFSSVDRRIADTPFYWSFDTAGEALSRSEPGFVTPKMVGRMDLYPRAGLPLLFRGWTVRPDTGVRETYYSASLNPSSTIGAPVSSDVNRRALLTSVEVRPPSLSRVFDRTFFGHKIKHTVEPRVRYEYVTGVGNFANIIRFDYRDILSDTNDVEYALVQRLYAKHAASQDCSNTEADQNAR
ncbi:MAG: LPS-assembly protein LptD, partial [Acidobacteriaceae bacterium]|nr:LPS-assembly protein LptD [Acidobacteriaceae bacterium]